MPLPAAGLCSSDPALRVAVRLRFDIVAVVNIRAPLLERARIFKGLLRNGVPRNV